MPALDQRLQLAFAHRIDEGLYRDVVRRFCPSQQLVERALGLETRILPRRKHLLRLVLRSLHVRLVEGIDLEDGAGDRDCELPTEELTADRVGLGELDLGTLPLRALRTLPA